MVKVVEFKMELSEEKRSLIDTWLKHTPIIWNIGLWQLDLLENGFSRNYHLKKLLDDGAKKEKSPSDKTRKSREQEAAQRNADLEARYTFPSSRLPWLYRYLWLDARTGLSVEATKAKPPVATAYSEGEWFIGGKWMPAEKVGLVVRLLVPFVNIVGDIRKTKERPVRNCTTPEGCDRAKSSGVAYIYTTSDPLDNGYTRKQAHGWLGNYYCLPWRKGYPIPTTEPVCDSDGFYLPPWSEGDRQEPMIWAEKEKDRGGLSKVVKYLDDLLVERGYSADIAKIVPSGYQYAVMKRLSTSWDNWKSFLRGKSNGIKYGRPRFRRTDKPDSTLSSRPGEDNHGLKVVSRDLVSIPGLGEVVVPGFSQRWVNYVDGKMVTPKIRSYNINVRSSGYYLQVCGDIERQPRLLKKAKPATAFDPGIRAYATFENGSRIENPKYYEKSADRIVKLQQEITRKQSAIVILWINQRSRTAEDLIAVCPGLQCDEAVQAIGSKSEAEIVEAIGSFFYGQLRDRIGKSKAIDRLQAKLSRLHEKIALQRKHFIQKQSTRLVRRHQTVIMETGMQSQELKRRNPAVASSDRSGFARNGQGQKTEISKKLSDTGYGEFASQIERKAKEWGRQAIRIDSKHTSEECSVCGNLENMPLERRQFECGVCGYKEERDRKSAILMFLKSVDLGLVKEGDLTPEVALVLARRREWQKSRESVAVENGASSGSRRTRRRKASGS